MMTGFRTHAAATLAAALPLLLAAGDSAAQETLPAAEQILERYHEAIGGVTAHAAVRSIHAAGELSVPMAGIAGSIETWQARPDRSLMHAVLPGFGEIRSGFDGTTAWSVNPVEGARIMTGDEAAQAADDANMDARTRNPALVASMSTVERTTVAGHSCYKVLTVWRSGRETTDCFSTDSGLLISSARRQVTSNGVVEAVMLYENYRVVESIRLPTRITAQIGGLDQIITLNEIRLNDVADSTFMPPPEIRNLIPD